jgi:hypothetical protein
MWVQLTAQAVKARMSANEHALYVKAAGHSQDFDMMAEIISQTVSLVRSKVAACRDNVANMGTAGLIPDECLHAAATIAKASLCAAFTVSEGETDLRKEELRLAHAYLDSVASCSVSIEGASGQPPNAAPVAYGSGPNLDWAQ